MLILFYLIKLMKLIFYILLFILCIALIATLIKLWKNREMFQNPVPTTTKISIPGMPAFSFLYTAPDANSDNPLRITDIFEGILPIFYEKETTTDTWESDTQNSSYITPYVFNKGSSLNLNQYEISDVFIDGQGINHGKWYNKHPVYKVIVDRLPGANSNGIEIKNKYLVFRGLSRTSGSVTVKQYDMAFNFKLNPIIGGTTRSSERPYDKIYGFIIVTANDIPYRDPRSIVLKGLNTDIDNLNNSEKTTTINDSATLYETDDLQLKGADDDRNGRHVIHYFPFDSPISTLYNYFFLHVTSCKATDENNSDLANEAQIGRFYLVYNPTIKEEYKAQAAEQNIDLNKLITNYEQLIITSLSENINKNADGTAQLEVNVNYGANGTNTYQINTIIKNANGDIFQLTNDQFTYINLNTDEQITDFTNLSNSGLVQILILLNNTINIENGYSVQLELIENNSASTSPTTSSIENFNVLEYIPPTTTTTTAAPTTTTTAAPTTTTTVAPTTTTTVAPTTTTPLTTTPLIELSEQIINYTSVLSKLDIYSSIEYYDVLIKNSVEILSAYSFSPISPPNNNIYKLRYIIFESNSNLKSIYKVISQSNNETFRGCILLKPNETYISGINRNINKNSTFIVPKNIEAFYPNLNVFLFSVKCDKAIYSHNFSSNINSITNISMFYNSTIKQVTLPYNITNINQNMFMSSNGLISLNIPKSVTTFDNTAFTATPLSKNEPEPGCVMTKDVKILCDSILGLNVRDYEGDYILFDFEDIGTSNEEYPIWINKDADIQNDDNYVKIRYTGNNSWKAYLISNNSTTEAFQPGVSETEIATYGPIDSTASQLPPPQYTIDIRNYVPVWPPLTTTTTTLTPTTTTTLAPTTTTTTLAPTTTTTTLAPTTTTTTLAPTTTTTTMRPTTTTTTMRPTTTTTTLTPTTTTTMRPTTTTTTTMRPTTTTTTTLAPTTTTTTTLAPTTTMRPTTTTTTLAPTTTTTTTLAPTNTTTPMRPTNTTTTVRPTNTTTTVRPTNTTTTVRPTTTTTTTLTPITTTMGLTATTLAPITENTITTPITTMQNIGLELMVGNGTITKTNQEIIELFTTYANGNQEVINILNKSNITVTNNKINILYLNTNLTDSIKNIWNDFTNTLKENKTQLTLDLLGIDEITNQKIFYISPVYNSEFEINCTIIGCSDSLITVRDNCTYPNYWCDDQNQVLIRNCK
jgi:hypothetical protein